MAQKEVSLKITVDGKEIDLAKTSITSFEKAYTDAQTKLATLKLGSEEWKKLDAEIKKAGVAFLDAKDSMKATDDVNKSLRTRLRETRNELEALEEAGQTNSAEFKKLRQTYDELNDAQEVARFRSGQLDDQLAALPGPIGKVGQGFKGLNDSLKILATNPFFLVITVVVGTLALLKKALDSTAEGQKTLAKFTDALQKVMGPLLALLEAVAVPLFNFLADIILKVAEGFAFFAEKVGISTGKIKEAQSGIEDFAAEEKRLAEEKEKRDAEAAEKEKQRLADKKAREAEYAQKKQAADKVLQEATIYLMTEENQKLTQEEIRHKEAMKVLRAAGYKNATAELKRHEQEKAKITKEYRDKEYLEYEKNYNDLVKFQTDKDNELANLEIANLETIRERKRLNEKLTLEDEVKFYDELFSYRKEIAEDEEQQALTDFDNQRELARKTALDQEGFDEMTEAMRLRIQEIYIKRKQNLKEQELNTIIKLNKDFNDRIKEEDLKAIDDQLRILELRSKALQQGTRAFFDLQRELLEKTYEKERMLAKNNADMLIEIEKKYQKDLKNLKEQELQFRGQIASQTINAIAAVTGALAQGYAAEANDTEKTMKQREAAFEKNKQYQLATAYMSAASGVIQILTQPSTLPSPFDWIVKGINAAALGIATAVNISTIKKTQFQGGGSSATSGGTQYADGRFRGYAEGGMIGGERHAQGGTLIEAEAGEAIMTRGAVTLFAPLLSAMNAMGGGTTFGSTMVSTYDKPKPESNTEQTTIIKTYVVETDLTSAQQKQARLKDLSTL
jgi:hypothetical protein